MHKALIGDARRRGDALVESTAQDAIPLVLLPDTPVIPNEWFAYLTERGTWGDIEALVRRWAATGCEWVNLIFAVEDGVAVVRYEARPWDEPLPDGRLPMINNCVLGSRS